jgi:5-methyltetrahydrofolate--homocysteine methyltransferase
MNRFLAMLDEGPVLIDGAMGTMLMDCGLEAGAPGELLNIDRAEVVRDVHAQYAAAGARILTTNTFNGNRIRLGRSGLAEHVAVINRNGVAAARAVCRSDGAVLGSMGPVGELLEPFGPIAREAAVAAFAEQAKLLADAGVDGFVVETMIDLEELLAALEGCRQAAGDLPVVACLTYSSTPRGFYSMMGQGVAEVVPALRAAGATVIGSNCQLGCAAMVELAAEMKAAGAGPWWIKPNAGKPEVREGVTHFAETAESFAEGAAQLAALGVTCIGGCCGTNPTFIAAARERLGLR